MLKLFIVFMFIIMLFILQDNYECYGNISNEIFDNIIKKAVYNNYRGTSVLEDTNFIYNMDNTYSTPYSVNILNDDYLKKIDLKIKNKKF